MMVNSCDKFNCMQVKSCSGDSLDLAQSPTFFQTIYVCFLISIFTLIHLNWFSLTWMK